MTSPLRPARVPSSNQNLQDDIEALEWLQEVGLPQYVETFETNFSLGGGLLSRKRLARLRLQDFPQMNITMFDHQKILMDHIKHTLQYSYNSPVRRREVKAKYFHSNADVKESKSSEEAKKAKVSQQKPKAKRETVSPRRRRSFDNEVWKSIEKYRTPDIKDALELLRGQVEPDPEVINPSAPPKKSKSTRRRRWTFGDDDDKLAASEKGTLYGNRALEYDIMQRELSALQSDHLNVFKNMINCKVASILFLNEKTRELMLYTDGLWYRMPGGSGVAGHCVETGQSINIPNAYDDPRFNKNFDLKTGFKTENIIAHPLRSQRGGGKIIGVVEMINKAGGFDHADEELLLKCVQRVADDLSARFQELLGVAEKFSGFSIFVGEKGGGPGSARTYDAPTKASISQRYQESKDAKDESKAASDFTYRSPRGSEAK